VLGECSSSVYYIVSQPGVESKELKANAPYLRNAVQGKNVQGRYAVNEVLGLGSGSVDELVRYLREKCGAQDASLSGGKIVYVRNEGKVSSGLAHAGNFPSLLLPFPSHTKLTKPDLTLHQKILSSLPSTQSYTLIYTTTPPHGEMLYEAAFEEPVHMDLKRQLMGRVPMETKVNDTRPLFEKYQFFTPGLFPLPAPLPLFLLHINPREWFW
jgi:hypothetical protein